MADQLNLSGHHLYTKYGFEATEDEQIDLFKIIPQKHLDHYLGCRVFVKIDRPMHSVHPKHEDMIYPINYGFLPFTLSMDGCEIDAYVIGPEKPLEYYSGEVVAIIKRKDDEEEKLVVSNTALTLGEIYENVYFTERYFKSEIVMKSTE
ncbi:MAG: inorganic diphosphatase [Clostridia bacterium]|nr:inorganic diphosphatase [Clostridia bacterium]